jgi:hypothetical protein
MSRPITRSDDHFPPRGIDHLKASLLLAGIDNASPRMVWKQAPRCATVGSSDRAWAVFAEALRPDPSPHPAGLRMRTGAFARFPAPLALKAVTPHRTPHSLPSWSRPFFSSRQAGNREDYGVRRSVAALGPPRSGGTGQTSRSARRPLSMSARTRVVSTPFVPGPLVSRVGRGGAAQDDHLFWPDHLGACHKLMVTHDFWRKMVKMLTCAH